MNITNEDLEKVESILRFFNKNTVYLNYSKIHKILTGSPINNIQLNTKEDSDIIKFLRTVCDKVLRKLRGYGFDTLKSMDYIQIKTQELFQEELEGFDRDGKIRILDDFEKDPIIPTVVFSSIDNKNKRIYLSISSTKFSMHKNKLSPYTFLEELSVDFTDEDVDAQFIGIQFHFKETNTGLNTAFKATIHDLSEIPMNIDIGIFFENKDVLKSKQLDFVELK